MPRNIKPLGDIINAFDFMDGKAEGGQGKHRVLGLGDNNIMYVWNWKVADWCPYMDYRTAQDLGLPDPGFGEVRTVDI